jgi:ABC-type Mn2+/Zn2+ transport system ATPase subunit
LLDEPFSGLDRPSSEGLEALTGELAAEGRGIVIATHDLEQARACDLVLCINKLQVACGRPDQVLDDLGVLEATYGGAIVELPGGGGRAILPPHHHHH